MSYLQVSEQLVYSNNYTIMLLFLDLNDKSKPCNHCVVVEKFIALVEAVDGTEPESIIGMIIRLFAYNVCVRSTLANR